MPQATTGTAMRSAASARDQRADIMRSSHSTRSTRAIGAQPDQRRVGVVRLIELRAARDGDARRLAKIARERADDQDAHGGLRRARSLLTISVIVTPSRLSSTITTSPRATRRLLT